MSLPWADLDNMIRNKSPCEDILSHPEVFRCYSAGNFVLMGYLKKNIKTLFRLAMSDSTEISSLNAYKMLTLVSNQLTQDVINNNLLLTFFPQIFENGEVNEIVASRYSVAASVILAADVNMASQSVQIFAKLLDFVHILSVYYLLQAPFTFPERFTTTRADILKLELHRQISDRISRVDASVINPNNLMDKTSEKLIAWYRILKSGIESEYFKKEYVSDPTLEALCNRSDVPQCVLDAKWSAIAAFCKKADPICCMVFLTRATEIITTKSKVLYPHMVYAVDVLTELCHVSPNVLENDFLQNVLRLLLDFPDATFLHLSVIRFIESVSKLEGVDLQVAMVFLPTLVAVAKMRTYSLCWITAYKIIGIFYEAGKKSKPLQKILPLLGDFVEFIQTDYEEHERLLKADYGGETKSIFTKITDLLKREID